MAVRVVQSAKAMPTPKPAVDAEEVPARIEGNAGTVKRAASWRDMPPRRAGLQRSGRVVKMFRNQQPHWPSKL
jgi:hypothetical protein